MTLRQRVFSFASASRQQVRRGNKMAVKGWPSSGNYRWTFSLEVVAAPFTLGSIFGQLAQDP